jgi:hypothetical protein
MSSKISNADDGQSQDALRHRQDAAHHKGHKSPEPSAPDSPVGQPSPGGSVSNSPDHKPAEGPKRDNTPPK